LQEILKKLINKKIRSPEDKFPSVVDDGPGEYITRFLEEIKSNFTKNG
jgi:hypothetical protein